MSKFQRASLNVSSDEPRLVPVRRRPAAAVPTQYRNRPPEIRVAIYRIWELAEELGLTRSMVAVLQALLAIGVNRNNPYQAIFASKKKLAALAKTSEASVYRALAKLSTDGLIVRYEQHRLADGSLDLSYCAITQTLATLLGLVADAGQGITASEQAPQEALHPTAEATAITASLDGRNVETSELPDDHSEDVEIAHQPAVKVTVRLTGTPEPDAVLPDTSPDLTVGLSDGMQGGSLYRVNGSERLDNVDASVNHQSTRAQRYVRMDGRSVPEELIWLITEKRLDYGQLFKLMTNAGKVKGQNLTAYVTYRSERLRALKSTNDCYRYLQSFIDNEIDATHLINERRKVEHKQHRREQRQHAFAQRDGWLKQNDGKVFVDPNTSRRYTINATHRFIQVREGDRFLPDIRVTGHVIKQFQSGRFEPYQAPVAARESALRHLAGLAKLRKSLAHSASV